MTETEKLILEALSDLKQEVTGLKQEITGLDQKVTRLDQKVTGLDQEVTGLNQKVTQVQKDLLSVKITLENDTNRKIDIIGEGHDFLKHRLSEALLMEQKRERMELDLVNLKMEVRKIKDHLDIA